jgi:protein-disulfide isomerase
MIMRLTRLMAISSAVLALLVCGPAQAQSTRAELDAAIEDYLARNPEAVQRIVRDYLLNNPELMQQMLAESLKRRAPSATDRAAAIRANAATLFNSSRQATLGDPTGDVTLVEFFDYNCAYCKRALADTMALLQEDPKLKIVLKDWPVLGPASTEAARVAVAVRMQDPAGSRYFGFHRRLLSERGRIDQARALAVAQELGFDPARLEQDMNSRGVRETLDESARLARALTLTVTPSYVVGETVVGGAAGMAVLKEKIGIARAAAR